MDAEIYKKVLHWSEALDGVFTLADLRVIFNDRVEVSVYKRLDQLLRAGTLIKVKRGIYATGNATLAAISHRIDPAAYVSTGTVLAQAAVIGSIPAHRIQAIKTGQPRVYRCQLGVIEHLSVTPRLYFGFNAVGGTLRATPEKAFLDVCYFAYRGKAFSFDPIDDVHMDDLNRVTIEGYLVHYEPRFITYFNHNWGNRWNNHNRH